MGALPVIQTILNDLIFFVAGGLVFKEMPDITARVTRYVRGKRREEPNHDR